MTSLLLRLGMLAISLGVLVWFSLLFSLSLSVVLIAAVSRHLYGSLSNFIVTGKKVLLERWSHHLFSLFLLIVAWILIDWDHGIIRVIRNVGWMIEQNRLDFHEYSFFEPSIAQGMIVKVIMDRRHTLRASTIATIWVLVAQGRGNWLDTRRILFIILRFLLSLQVCETLLDDWNPIGTASGADKFWVWDFWVIFILICWSLLRWPILLLHLGFCSKCFSRKVFIVYLPIHIRCLWCISIIST